MERYALAERYTSLRQAARRGDSDAATAVLCDVLGLDSSVADRWRAAGRPTTPPDRCVTRLRYRGFKPAELVMLAANLKPVVKFEDVPEAQARAFVARYADTYRLQVTRPYFKDRLLLRTRRTGSRDEGPLVTVYASRGDEGLKLQRLERDSRDAIVDAGALLGFPPCCVQAFAATFERARRDQDTINDDAVRALLAATSDIPGRQALDPLHDLDLLAFYPCGPRCDAAMRFAARTYDALTAARPETAARARAELGDATLFWRLPFYVVLHNARGAGAGVRYDGASLHTFPDGEVARIQRLFGGLVLPALDLGDHVALEDGAIVVSRGDALVARLPPRRTTVPAGAEVSAPSLPPPGPVLGVWDRSLDPDRAANF